MNNNLTHKNYDLFDNDVFFGNFLNSMAKDENKIMRTDILEKENEYEMSVELPGVNKENIKISLEDENLIVSVSINKKEENNGKYLHKERYYGSFERSYYVGDIKDSDINASFNNGLLKITFPKESAQKEEKKYISIN